MVRVCMACGKRSEIEPLSNKDETHGLCAGLCVLAFNAWTMQGKDGVTLPEFYLRELSQLEKQATDYAFADVHEKDASRASWLPQASS